MDEIYETNSKSFSSIKQVASCYLRVKGKILMLKRASNKSDPGVWGLPGGKLEKGETPLEAAVREFSEETGIVLESVRLHPIASFYIRRKEEYLYHTFASFLEEFPPIILSPEHDESRWVALDEVQSLPLIPGSKEVFRRYLKSFPS